MPERPSAEDRPLHFGYYLVVYIDLLGQSRELEKIRQLPNSEAEWEAAWAAIDRSSRG